VARGGKGGSRGVDGVGDGRKDAGRLLKCQTRGTRCYSWWRRNPVAARQVWCPCRRENGAIDDIGCGAEAEAKTDETTATEAKRLKRACRSLQGGPMGKAHGHAARPHSVCRDASETQICVVFASPRTARSLYVGPLDLGADTIFDVAPCLFAVPHWWRCPKALAVEHFLACFDRAYVD
jgi:hypothetical protein